MSVSPPVQSPDDFSSSRELAAASFQQFPAIARWCDHLPDAVDSSGTTCSVHCATSVLSIILENLSIRQHNRLHGYAADGIHEACIVLLLDSAGIAQQLEGLPHCDLYVNRRLI